MSKSRSTPIDADVLKRKIDEIPSEKNYSRRLESLSRATRVGPSTIKDWLSRGTASPNYLDQVVDGLRALGVPVTTEELIPPPPPHPYPQIVQDAFRVFDNEPRIARELNIPPSFEVNLIDDITGRLRGPERVVFRVDNGGGELERFWQSVARQCDCYSGDTDEHACQDDVVGRMRDLVIENDQSPLMIIEGYSRCVVEAMNDGVDTADLLKKVSTAHHAFFRRLPCCVLVTGTLRIRNLFNYLRDTLPADENSSTARGRNLISEQFDQPLKFSTCGRKAWDNWIDGLSTAGDEWNQLSDRDRGRIKDAARWNPLAMLQALRELQKSNDAGLAEPAALDSLKNSAVDVWNAVPHTWHDALRTAGTEDRQTAGAHVKVLQDASILNNEGAPFVAEWGPVWMDL